MAFIVFNMLDSAAFIVFNLLDSAAFIRGRRLFEGSVYSVRHNQ